MEFEEYEKRIRSLPVEQLHVLVEQDPDLAAAWAAADQARADPWAKAHGAEPDERAKAELWSRLTCWLRQNGRCVHREE